MIKDIKYATTVNFVGRNGFFKQTGISVQSVGQVITLQPFTSRGVIGNGFLEIPLDSVDEVINALRSAKSNSTPFKVGQLVQGPMGHPHIIKSVIPDGRGSF